MKSPNLSLSRRLVLLTAIALVPAFAIIGFNEISLRHAREAEAHAYALRSSELALLELERIITGAAALMAAVSTSPDVGAQNPQSCQTYLSALQQLLPQISVIGVADATGAVFCAVGVDSLGEMQELADSLSDGLAASQLAVGTYFETAEGASLPLAMRLPGAAGAPENEVIAGIDLAYLGRLISERAFTQGSALTVADANGTILAREPQPEQYVGQAIPPDFQWLVRAESPGTFTFEGQEGIARIVGYQPARAPLNLYVSSGISIEEVMAPINESTFRGIALAIGGGILALFLAWSFGRAFIRRPVARLTDTLAAWRAGDHNARTAMRSGAAEFHQVGSAIDLMLDELEQRQRAQRDAESQRDVLARELDHRVKNLLAIVQSIANQTFRSTDLPPEALRSFRERLAVMATAHHTLTAEGWSQAPMRETVEGAIRPFNAEERFTIGGDELMLKPKAALSLALALHELCTNASKYGALSTPDGTVAIDWALVEDGEEVLIRWTEAGGPAVLPPTKRGFGSQLIERVLQADLGARVEMSYEDGGVVMTARANATVMLAREKVA